MSRMHINRARYENLVRGIQRIRELGLIDWEEATYLTNAFRHEFLSQCGARVPHFSTDEREPYSLAANKIVYNPPATIVFWGDGTKTIVKAAAGTEFNAYHAFTAAVAKKLYGNNSRVNKIVNKWNKDPVDKMTPEEARSLFLRLMQVANNTQSRMDEIKKNMEPNGNGCLATNESILNSISGTRNHNVNAINGCLAADEYILNKIGAAMKNEEERKCHE